MRKDKQLFRDLDVLQLEWIVDGLDMVLDAKLQKDLSVMDVRPIYLLKRRAQEELNAKLTLMQDEFQEQRKLIRAASEELLHEEPADA